MDIILRNVRVEDLFASYEDNGDGGVRGFGGKLNIRPAFQREFIYGPKERDQVIHTLRRGYPLNTMYWAVVGDGFELMDGQQRTISICQYVQGDFSIQIDGRTMFFTNLTKERRQQILDYELTIYECDGTDGEKLDWFKVINIAGKALSTQELRNAIYTGPWLADAKRWFSRKGVTGDRLGEKYLSVICIRQEVLEKALNWISGGDIEGYMSRHQHDQDAQELWQYFQAVIAWVQRIFPAYRPPMKGLDWGRLYNAHRDDPLNAAKMERRIAELMLDDEVTDKRGIYEYLLTGDERTLSLRAFDDAARQVAYEKQTGICPMCKKRFDLKVMQADHIVPWSRGGKTTQDNCQMLCVKDHQAKSAS
jgi:hypothetical protein